MDVSDGLMDRFVDQTKTGISEKPFDGTPTYVSLAVHKGSFLGYRDEVESMVGSTVSVNRRFPIDVVYLFSCFGL